MARIYPSTDLTGTRSLGRRGRRTMAMGKRSKVRQREMFPWRGAGSGYWGSPFYSVLDAGKAGEAAAKPVGRESEAGMICTPARDRRPAPPPQLGEHPRADARSRCRPLPRAPHAQALRVRRPTGLAEACCGDRCFVRCSRPTPPYPPSRFEYQPFTPPNPRSAHQPQASTPVLPGPECWMAAHFCHGLPEQGQRR